MPNISNLIRSSVGKKVVMALTGLAMAIFLIEHVLGNLLLFNDDPVPYNEYAHFLISLGWIIIVAELVLIAFLLSHSLSGISVWRGKKKARPQGYDKQRSAGSPSKMTFSSKTMIFSGILLFVFIIIHLKTFKFGPYYTMTVDGEEIRDLHRLVYETFQSPLYVVWYVGCLVFMGFHLRHGIWSAFQSLGVTNAKITPLIYSVGILLAIAIAVGFIGIPIWIFFTGA